MCKFHLAIKCSFIAAGAILALSCHAQVTATTPPASDKKESHEHKHPLPTEVPIPHRLESVPTQAHPEQARQRVLRAESLPQR